MNNQVELPEYIAITRSACLEEIKDPEFNVEVGLKEERLRSIDDPERA